MPTEIQIDTNTKKQNIKDFQSSNHDTKPVSQEDYNESHHPYNPHKNLNPQPVSEFQIYLKSLEKLHESQDYKNLISNINHIISKKFHKPFLYSYITLGILTCIPILLIPDPSLFKEISLIDKILSFYPFAQLFSFPLILSYLYSFFRKKVQKSTPFQNINQFLIHNTECINCIELGIKIISKYQKIPIKKHSRFQLLCHNIKNQSITFDDIQEILYIHQKMQELFQENKNIKIHKI